jgi:NADH-quinone oxidoreductase subunit L
MFLACGVGAYQTAVFHLMTHAFFKALLFLGSGSVIHACSGEQDMTKMGGLKKHLPHTHLTMLIGSLAISGIPFFSGFFSKDEILYSVIALPNGHTLLFFVGVITAALTAIYTGRMMTITFYGEDRLSHEAKHHLHESPATMLIPLYVLAVLAAFGGFLGVPHLLGEHFSFHHWLSHWLSPLVPTRELPIIGVKLALHEGLVMAGSSVLAIVCFTFGIVTFEKKFNIGDHISAFKKIEKVLENKYFIDEIYGFVIVAPLKFVGKICAELIDKVLIDGFLMGLGRGTRDLGKRFKTIQTGDVQAYAYVLVLALVGILWFAFKRMML